MAPGLEKLLWRVIALSSPEGGIFRKRIKSKWLEQKGHGVGGQQQDTRKSKYTSLTYQAQDFEFVFTKIISLTTLYPDSSEASFQLGLNFGL